MTEFFEEQTDQSLVKATITTKYLWAWSTVIINYLKKQGQDPKIGYIDLFAGPGRYKNGAMSTPLMILERAISDPQFHNSLVTIFNDKDENNTNTLQDEIAQLPRIDSLKFYPKVHCSEVGENIVTQFEEMELIPVLMFVDPWGYKGLSLRLINAVLKDWACECIFFFNYNRINMGLNNDLVKKHMSALFGEDRVDYIRDKIKELSPPERELAVVEELSQSLRELGGNYVLPFCFRNAKGTRTSHHLIFVSKHRRGYDIMKEIMAKESSAQQQGVGTFEYSPADKDAHPFLYELTRPLDDLESLLLEKYSGVEINVRALFDEHNVDTPYIIRNYKDVLKRMFAEKQLTAYRPSGNKIRKNSFPDDVMVKFPDHE